MDANIVVINGVLATEPETRSLGTGHRSLRLLITVRGDAPRRRVDVIPVTLWDPPDELDVTELGRGTRLWIVGAVQRRFFESRDGRRSRLEVVAHSVHHAGTAQPADAAGPTPV